MYNISKDSNEHITEDSLHHDRNLLSFGLMYTLHFLFYFVSLNLND